jgi:tight adherence protein C
MGVRALAVLAVLCGAAILAGTGMWMAIAVGPVVAMAAARGPEMVLARIGKRRQHRIATRVPDLVEPLVTTTRAGLSPAIAFRRSAGILRGPLADEVALAVQEMDLGLPWSRALETMVERNDVPALRRLAIALARSRRLGTSIGSTLRSVAEDLRADRRARAEEAARRAPVKMLFPLVFLVLPAFLLLTVGPVVLATIRSLH